MRVPIKPDNVFARLHRYTYEDSDYTLPTNFCPFFWSTVVALILLPLPVLSGHILEKYLPRRSYDSRLEHGIFSIIGITFVLAVTTAAITGFVLPLVMSIQALLLGNPSAFVCIVSIYLMAGVLAYLSVFDKQNTHLVRDTYEFIKPYVVSKYRKICPEIQWVDKDASKV